MSALLEVRQVTKKFGGLTANNNVTFDVHDKEILSVIGPNGAGKSTLFKMISSFLPTTSGEVLYQGRADLQPQTAYRRAQGGRTHISGNHDLQKHDGARKRHRGPAPARQGLAGRVFLGTKTAHEDVERFGRYADELMEFLGLMSDIAG